MQDIQTQLKKVVHDLYDLDFDPEITPSPANIDADYSSNAPLKLAKELHKPPMTIAEELRDRYARVTDLEGAPRPQLYEDGGGKSGRTRAEISMPGFLNFTLGDDYLVKKIDDLDKNFEHEITSDKFKGKTVICEFSDPNPFKVLHVGHLYTSIVGDSISRLFEYAGANVIRANFGGDVGLHVAKTMYALQRKDINKLTIEDIAKSYIEGTAAYEEDEHAREEITKLNKEIYQINAESICGRVTDMEGIPQSSRREELREGNVRQDPSKDAIGRTRPVNKLAELYWRGRELSYDYFRDFYAKIGIKFDKYYPESTVAALGLETVKKELKAGVYEESNDAVIFNGDKYGLHTRVFINKEGVPTYEAKDVGLIFTKWQDYHFDKSVVITGSEQKEYMAVVLKSVEQYAPELVRRTTHLTHGLVKLPGGIKMSSRKGNFLKAIDVLDMVNAALQEEHHSTNELISLAATKYAFLKYKMGGQIIFDPAESVKMTGNSGPYLLYSAVRAKKILQKIAEAGVADNVFLDDISRFSSPETYIPAGAEKAVRRANFPGRPAYDVEGEKVHHRKDMSVRTPASEKNLMKKLLEYKSVLQESVTEMAPHKVATYLYELAQDFSRFYENCPVNGSNRERERVKLVQVYLDTMTHGLNLLGINIPEEM